MEKRRVKLSSENCWKSDGGREMEMSTSLVEVFADSERGESVPAMSGTKIK